jgi:hypothetical protein
MAHIFLIIGENRQSEQHFNSKGKIMSLMDTIALTIFNVAACLLFPKLLSSLLSAKPKQIFTSQGSISSKHSNTSEVPSPL